jgi:excisionase family DNA binding protein
MAEFTAATLPARHLYRVSEAMLLLSLSRSVIYELIRSGRLRSVTEGRTRLIPAAAIAAYIDLLTTEAKENDYGQPA